MMITKTALPRRTFLRGAGATLALPFLDAMVPALAAAGSNPARPVRRAAFVYFPNGANMAMWKPTATGAGFPLSPSLAPLEPLRDYVTVLTGIDNLAADARGDGGGDHPRASAAWLSAVHPKRREGADAEAGTTLDQIIASAIGQDTQLASLEVGLEPVDLAGRCGAQGYACIYGSTTSWKTPTLPLPMEINPRYVFERMFGEGADAAERVNVMRRNRSVLDSVLQELQAFRRTLGSGDTRRVNEYVDSIRDVERRIQKAEEQSASGELGSMVRPVGVPDTFEDHIRLMYDLQVLAFETDITRVTSFMIGREISQRTFPAIGVSDAWHAISHHRGDPKNLANVAKIDRHLASLFAEYLEKLRSKPDGDGNLLEHSLILYGACISEGERHLHTDLPLVLAGHAAGRLKGGRHLTYNGAPMGNLLVSMAGKMGLEVEAVGESTGRLEELSAV